jgi:hypothetical protein
MPELKEEPKMASSSGELVFGLSGHSLTYDHLLASGTLSNYISTNFDGS